VPDDQSFSSGGEHRIPQDSAAGRRRPQEALESRRAAAEGEVYQPIRRGWFFGEKTLKEELLEQVSPRKGYWHYGEELREAAKAKAERIVTEEIKRRKGGWGAGDAAQRRRGETCHCPAAATGDHDEAGLDSVAVALGHEDTPGAFALLARKARKK
jgi:hypothetical protein